MGWGGGYPQPGVGNVAVALAVSLALGLNLALTGGADVAVFAICPLLLLLNQVRQRAGRRHAPVLLHS